MMLYDVLRRVTSSSTAELGGRSVCLGCHRICSAPACRNMLKRGDTLLSLWADAVDVRQGVRKLLLGGVEGGRLQDVLHQGTEPRLLGPCNMVQNSVPVEGSCRAPLVPEMLPDTLSSSWMQAPWSQAALAVD